MKHLSLIYFFSILIFPLACSNEQNLGDFYTFMSIKDSNFKGFAFTAHKEYNSSILYWYDFKSGQVREIIKGQSGDPKIFYIQNKIFLFNRNPNQSNYLSLQGQYPFEVSQEIPLRLPFGDPHSVLEFRDNEVLISCPESHKLKHLNLLSGKQKTLFEEKSFRPGTITLVSGQNKTNIIIPSLGLSPNYKIDNSQGIYEFKASFEQEKKEASFIKKHKTIATYSDALFHLRDDIFFTFSLGNPKNSLTKKSFEVFKLKDDFKFLKAKSLEKLDHLERWGGAIKGNKNIFYTSVKNHKTSQIEIREFTVIDLETLTSKVLHTFKSNYPPLLAHDSSNDLLLIGESHIKKKGKFYSYQKGKIQLLGEIDLSPYQGVFVP